MLIIHYSVLEAIRAMLQMHYGAICYITVRSMTVPACDYSMTPAIKENIVSGKLTNKLSWMESQIDALNYQKAIGFT